MKENVSRLFDWERSFGKGFDEGCEDRQEVRG